MKRYATALLLAVLALPLAARAIVVEEYFDPTTQSGTFGIRNDGPDPIVAFAVANNTLTGANGNHELYRVWASGIITQANWDAGRASFEAAVQQILPSFSVPAFAAAFPAGPSGSYDKAVVYWAQDLLGPAEQALVLSLAWEPGTLSVRDPLFQSIPAYHSRAIAPGDDATYSNLGILGFYFYATAPASPFIALTQTLQFQQGEALLVAIPEAETWLLMLAGLGLVAWQGRRRARA